MGIRMVCIGLFRSWQSTKSVKYVLPNPLCNRLFSDQKCVESTFLVPPTYNVS